MRAKTLKSSQILRAHMPYFRRPSHICRSTFLDYVGLRVNNIVHLMTVQCSVGLWFMTCQILTG